MKKQLKRLKLALKYRYLYGGVKQFYACGEMIECYIKQIYNE